MSTRGRCPSPSRVGLVAATPAERLGQTMGAAEPGRELGDAGGPLIVAGAAAATILSGAFAALAVLTAAAALAVHRTAPRPDPTDNPTA